MPRFTRSVKLNQTIVNRQYTLMEVQVKVQMAEVLDMVARVVKLPTLLVQPMAVVCTTVILFHQPLPAVTVSSKTSQMMRK
jgi:hypothetical protein